MKTELIRAERLLFGSYRYRLEVARTWWVFRHRAVYFARTAPLTWHDRDGFPAGQRLSDDLTTLLARALTLKNVPPQVLPYDLVAGLGAVEIAGNVQPLATYLCPRGVVRGVNRG